ncbi:MAG: esterase/lipase family protein [Chitinispirillaceae bacterium]
MKLLLMALICMVLVFVRCGYMGMALRRMNLSEIQKTYPSMSIDREINTEKCYTIYGRIKSVGRISHNIAVAAISYRYGKQEIVGKAFACNEGFYSLVLPVGQYQLFAFADVNNDSLFTQKECAGFFLEKSPLIEIDSSSTTIKRYDISVSDRHVFTIDQPVSIRLPDTYHCSPSHYYPPGAVRSLDDTIFSDKVAELGIYNPSEFLDNAGIYFYALQERNLRKTPVLCVPGYGGSPREFEKIISELDSSRFDFWFFYYPGAQSLSKSASILYEIFFSGNIIKLRGRKLYIIAHSMGGLVARQALNLYSRKQNRTAPVEFISLCTPYGGIESAKDPFFDVSVMLPSWRQLAAESGFLDSLHSSRLAPSIQFYLFFGFKNPAIIKFSETSDGTVKLKNQLPYTIQDQADEIRGFNETHESILTSDECIERVTQILNE